MKNATQIAMREGKEFYRSGILKGSWSPDELLARVDAIETYHDSVPRRIRRYFLWTFGGLAVALVSWIAWNQFPDSMLGLAQPGLFFELLTIAGLVLAGVTIFFWIKFGGRRKYNDDGPRVVGNLIRCIREDLQPDTRLRVVASLKPPIHDDFKVGTGDNPRGGKDTFFQREILALGCSLRDGTKLQTRILERSVKTVRWKKSASGKMKQKVKYKRRVITQARLVLNNERNHLTGSLKLPRETKIRIRRRPGGTALMLALRSDMGIDDSLEANTLLGILAGAYSAITSVKQQKRGSK